MKADELYFTDYKWVSYGPLRETGCTCTNLENNTII